MTPTTPEQQHDWLTEAYRKLREQQAEYRRSRFRLVVNRDKTPEDRPVWYRKSVL